MNPAIVMGNAKSVLKLGPSGVTRGKICTQEDSDVIGHFIQVAGCLSRCKWRNDALSVPVLGSPGTAKLPRLEGFIFAAVYIRQLSPEENLMHSAVAKYLDLVDSYAKSFWITEEMRRFDAQWSHKSQVEFYVNDFSTLELFRAFLYGAYIFHGPKKKESKKAIDSFKKLIGSHDQNKILLTLHGGLHHIVNHVNRIARVIQQDYANWTNAGIAPRPEVHWHSGLFSPTCEGNSSNSEHV